MKENLSFFFLALYTVLSFKVTALPDNFKYIQR